MLSDNSSKRTIINKVVTQNNVFIPCRLVEAFHTHSLVDQVCLFVLLQGL